MKTLAALTHARRIGLSTLFRRARVEVWSTKRVFQLTCDLSAIPELTRRGKLEVRMKPVDTAAFRGFRDELAHSSPGNYFKVLLRILYCRAGVDTLYVATGDNGDPLYAQWLIAPDGQQRIPRYLPGRYPALTADQLMLEGAYTFERYRGYGLMADGMGQLVEAARDRGAPTLVTYVADDNVPSLRGCARVGFTPSALRVSSRRTFLRRTRMLPVGPRERAVWEAAVAPRS